MGRSHSREPVRGSLEAEDGKGMSVADCSTYKPNVDPKDYVAQRGITGKQVEEAMNSDSTELYGKRRGIDFYHRYEGDLDLFQEMGFKTSESLHPVDQNLSHRSGGGA